MKRLVRHSTEELCLVLLAATTCFARTAPDESGLTKQSAAQPANTAANQYTLVVPPGLSPIANHFNQGGNTVAELLPKAPGETLLYRSDNQIGSPIPQHNFAN